MNKFFHVFIIFSCLISSGFINSTISAFENSSADIRSASIKSSDGFNYIADEETSGSEDEEELPKWSGDVYRISADELDEVLTELARIGGKVLFHRDDLYLIIYPENSLNEEVSLNSRLKKVGDNRQDRPALKLPGRRAYSTMENARFAFDANFIHAGTGLPQAFDGSGVVVGFTDIGFDANHNNFLNAAGTESRVRRFINLRMEDGRIDRCESPEEIKEYRTDHATHTHATHVAGILAGRGGDGKYMGMAPGADIVATTSDLYDVVILAGIEEIIEYAKSVGKPAVINISLGNYGGPHDGTSLFCQYLDKCAEDAIICIATGNEAEKTNHIGHRFSSADDKIIFRVKDMKWTFFDIEGYTDIYSEDDSQLKTGIYIQDTVGNVKVFESPMIDFAEDPEYVLTSDESKAAADPRYHYDARYAQYFDGDIAFVGDIDPNNGRFRASIYYMTHTDERVSDTKRWAKYQIGGYVQGVAGKYVDLYADGSHTSFINNQGSPHPDSKMSVSDLATGHKVITVGAYWVSEGTLMYSGNTWGGGTPMTACGFSGYGTLGDGRVIPMTVAPGGPITSSYSGAYTETNGNGNCAYEFDGDYWGLDSGTSMSTPYVAGAIATWLQAKPDMNWEEVQELVKKSNNAVDYPLTADPRNGQGFFDPYNGLKMLAAMGYTDVETSLSKSVFCSYANNRLIINNPDSRYLQVRVYATDGRLISSHAPGASERVVLTAEEMNLTSGHGVAICQIAAPGTSSQILKIAY